MSIDPRKRCQSVLKARDTRQCAEHRGDCGSRVDVERSELFIRDRFDLEKPALISSAESRVIPGS